MRIACESTPNYELKPPHDRSLIAKPWEQNHTINLSNSNQSSSTEEISFYNSSDSLQKDYSTDSLQKDYSTDSLQKDYSTIPDSFPLKFEFEFEAEAITDEHTKSLVGIIITTPRKLSSSSRMRRSYKRVRFGHAQIISTHKPASEMVNDEISRIHYQAEDDDIFRGTAKLIADEIRNQASPEQQRQTQTTMKIRSSSHSYGVVMTKTYQMCEMRAILSTKAPVCLTDNTDHTKKDPTKNNNTRSLLEKNNSERRESGKEEIIYSTGLDSHHADFSDRTCLTYHLFEKLTHWIKVGHSRRGLEKISVPYLVEARPLSRQAAKNAVLATQDIIKNLGNFSDEKKEKERVSNQEEGAGHCRLHHVWGWWQYVSFFSSKKHKNKVVHGDIKENDSYCRTMLLERLGIPKDVVTPSLSNEEVLRIVSEEYTRTAKLFALAMGHADAAALGLYCDNSKNT